jgi:protein-S-isoprenylcysteine O-methyltransferase Ste14
MPIMTVPQMIVRMLVLVLLLLAVLFISAGTVDWPMAWAYVAITVILTAGSRLLLARHSPDLVAERAASVGKADAKPWDRLLMPIVAIYGPLLTLVVAGLDRRFGWTSAMPLWIAIVGAILLILANLLGAWAMLANRFFSGVVRIQHERGHSVVSDGPYRWVRHPGYAGGFIGDLALPLLLGSAWAFIPAALTAGAVVLRTALEDRTLQAELPGYREYAQRTRYRLLPGLW